VFSPRQDDWPSARRIWWVILAGLVLAGGFTTRVSGSLLYDPYTIALVIAAVLAALAFLRSRRS
jgi:hypothetical protein